MGWTIVPTSANFAKVKITLPQLTIKEAGFVFVYLSYEDQSNNYVYFDDFRVTHTKSNLIQASEYYPFGMQTANSWTRESMTANNFLGNGGTELNQTSQLYDLEFRNYDPTLGRMYGVDPVAGKYSSLTPYNYSFNNPVGHNDPSGADPYPTSSNSNLWYNNGAGAYGYPGLSYDDYVPPIGNGQFFAPVSSFYGWASGGPGGGLVSYGSASIAGFLNQALGSLHGGSWNNGSSYLFQSNTEAFEAGVAYNNRNNSWGSSGGTIHSTESAARTTYQITAAKLAIIRVLGMANLKRHLESQILLTKPTGPFTACAKCPPVEGAQEQNNSLGLSEYDIPVWGSARRAADAFEDGRYLDAAAWEAFGVVEMAGVGALYRALAAQTAKLLARVAVSRGPGLLVQFGGTPEKIYHAFRHTDKLGLDRNAVQNAIHNHLTTSNFSFAPGQHINSVIEVGGIRLQYTAWKLENGVINVGRIHGIK